MSIIASKYYPITDMYFKTTTEIDLSVGGDIIKQNEPPIFGIHIFNWNSDSWITIQTESGQFIKFNGGSLIEGAIYYMQIKKLVNAGPTNSKTKVMAVSASTQP